VDVTVKSCHVHKTLLAYVNNGRSLCLLRVSEKLSAGLCLSTRVSYRINLRTDLHIFTVAQCRPADTNFRYTLEREMVGIGRV